MSQGKTSSCACFGGFTRTISGSARKSSRGRLGFNLLSYSPTHQSIYTRTQLFGIKCSKLAAPPETHHRSLKKVVQYPTVANHRGFGDDHGPDTLHSTDDQHTVMPDHPLPGKFDEDLRVHIDKTTGNYQYEDDETGQEFEWSEKAKAWIPLVRRSTSVLS